MKEKLFPVDTATGCPLKWNWSTIYFHSGHTSSCHRTEKLKIPDNDFASFHNLPTKIDDRLRMLEGQWPKTSCEYCSRVEKKGGYSDRMNQLSLLTDVETIPPELLKDKNATSVSPTFIEVYFRNTCNMSCVYCGPHFSSKWEEELNKYGPIDGLRDKNKISAQPDLQHNKNYEKHKKDFFQYLLNEDRYKVLRWFSFLGGEPLVIPELEECLDFWEQNPNDKLTFQIITNLKANEYRFDKFIKRMDTMTKNKKVLQFKIVASLDCMGPESEYVRYGMDLKQWERNFKKLIELDHVELGINSAISLLTLPTYPQLLDKINEWNGHRPSNKKIIRSFNVESLTHPAMAGPEFFSDTFKLCEEKIKITTVRDISIKKHWDGLIGYIKNSKYDGEKIDRTKKYLTELDRRRNTDWKKTFPWLIDL